MQPCRTPDYCDAWRWRVDIGKPHFRTLVPRDVAASGAESAETSAAGVTWRTRGSGSWLCVRLCGNEGGGEFAVMVRLKAAHSCEGDCDAGGREGHVISGSGMDGSVHRLRVTIECVPLASSSEPLSCSHFRCFRYGERACGPFFSVQEEELDVGAGTHSVQWPDVGDHEFWRLRVLEGCACTLENIIFHACEFGVKLPDLSNFQRLDEGCPVYSPPLPPPASTLQSRIISPPQQVRAAGASCARPGT